MTRHSKLSSSILSVLLAIVICFSMILLTPEKSYAATKKPSKVILSTVKSIDHNAIKISWKKANNAKKYQVWRATSKNGKYKLIKTTTAKTFTNKKLITGKKYYYKVRAINGTKKGNFSTKKYAIPTLKQTVGIKLTSTENTVKITWSKVNGAKGYQIYRSSTKNGAYKKVITTSKLTSSNKKLTASKDYYYKIRAYKKIDGKFKYGKFSTVKYIKTKAHTYTKKIITPTCTRKGNTTYTCKVCGKNKVTDYVPSLGHDYSGTVTRVVEPTCEVVGTDRTACTRCNSHKDVTVPKLDHNVEVLSTVAPTCESKGYDIVECKHCHKVDTDNETSALGHDWFVDKNSEGIYEEQCFRVNCGARATHVHNLVAVYDEPETRLGYSVKTELGYYGCQVCGGQLAEPYETAGGQTKFNVLDETSDASKLEKAQAAHDKFHAPDGVKPVYGWVVVSSEEKWVADTNNKVISHHVCKDADRGCTYVKDHNHLYNKSVSLPVDGQYMVVKIDKSTYNKLYCSGCLTKYGDGTIYRGSDVGTLSDHRKVHMARNEFDNMGSAWETGSVPEYIRTYQSQMSTNLAMQCSVDGCHKVSLTTQ